jgi:FkbM family methyltransferase
MHSREFSDPFALNPADREYKIPVALIPISGTHHYKKVPRSLILPPALGYVETQARGKLVSAGEDQSFIGAVMQVSDRVKSVLDQEGFRVALAPIASWLAKARNRGVKRIFHDGEVWVHETTTGYFAYDQPFVRLDLRRLHAAAHMNFFWGYQPRPGDIVIDIGAAVGEETLSFSEAVGPHGKVICVEAHPRTFRCLEKLVRYNQLINVITVHRAITDIRDETVRITDSDTYVGNRLSSGLGTPVQTITVDALCEALRLDRVHFLKMNIEGAERLAIQGMRETLKRTELLCISCHDFLADRSGDASLRTKNEVKEFLQGNGIRVSRADALQVVHSRSGVGIESAVAENGSSGKLTVFLMSCQTGYEPQAWFGR